MDSFFVKPGSARGGGGGGGSKPYSMAKSGDRGDRGAREADSEEEVQLVEAEEDSAVAVEAEIEAEAASEAEEANEEFDSQNEDEEQEDEEEEKPKINGNNKRRLELPVDEEEESIDEKRIRLAKEYLRKLSSAKGDMNRNITMLRGHNQPVTCVAVSDDEKHLFSASRDAIIHWDLTTMEKISKVKATINSKLKKAKDLEKRLAAKAAGDAKPVENKNTYFGRVLAMALSHDAKYLVTGGEEKVIKVWDVENGFKVVETFRGHRDVVTALAFRRGTYTLYSGSNDRTLKIWDLSQMAFVDTRYGHQSPITAIDALSRERCITASNDRTCRVWKIPEETQLIYRGHSSSIDRVSLLAEDRFVSGSADGSISLWNVSKKTPLHIQNNAHPSESLAWVASVACVKFADLVASGGCDGRIRLWGVVGEKLKEVNTVKIDGFINDLVFSKAGDVLFAGIGQEHKFGRWHREGAVKNGVAIIKLDKNQEKKDLSTAEQEMMLEEDDDDEDIVGQDDEEDDE
eukprot:gene15959-18973_t